MINKKVPKVSVIIPVWNRELELSECLGSVLDQSFTDYEVVVVDNASTDGTKSVIHEFARKDPRVKYAYEPIPGIGSARYRGEISSLGKVILMTDSDCEVPPDWIERMSAPVLAGNIQALQGMKHAIGNKYWAIQAVNEEHRFMKAFLKQNGTSIIDTANFCVDRSVLERVGYSDRTIHNLNDTELAARFIDRGIKVKMNETSVGHKYLTSPLKLAKLLFSRATIHSSLRKRYPGNPIFSKETFKLSLAYFRGLLFEMILMKKTFPYNLVTGISWRLGLLWGHMKKAK